MSPGPTTMSPTIPANHKVGKSGGDIFNRRQVIPVSKEVVPTMRAGLGECIEPLGPKS